MEKDIWSNLNQENLNKLISKTLLLEIYYSTDWIEQCSFPTFSHLHHFILPSECQLSYFIIFTPLKENTWPALLAEMATLAKCQWERGSEIEGDGKEGREALTSVCQAHGQLTLLKMPWQPSICTKSTQLLLYIPHFCTHSHIHTQSSWLFLSLKKFILWDAEMLRGVQVLNCADSDRTQVCVHGCSLGVNVVWI